MSALGYVVHLFPDATDPLRVVALDGDGREVPVRGATLLDAADAILADHAGRRWPLTDVMAFARRVFGGLGSDGVVAVTVKAEAVAGFCGEIAC